MLSSEEIARLVESEECFRTTFDEAAIGIAHVGTDGSWLQVNQSLCQMLGYERDELLCLKFQDLTPSRYLEQDLKVIRTMLAGRELKQIFEKCYIRKDSSQVWAEVTVSLVRPKSRVPYFLAIIEDITLRKETQEALRLAQTELEKRVEQRTRELSLSNSFLLLEMRERERAQLERDRFFELSLDILAITDFNGYFRRVNPAFCKLLGYSTEELTNIHRSQIVHPDDLSDSEKQRTSEVIKDGEFRDFEVRYITKTGGIKWLSWSGRSYSNLGLTYLTARDITERIARQEMEEQNQAMLATNSKLNAIGLMAANIAHEINNPLTVIYGEGCVLRKMAEQGAFDLSRLGRISENIVSMSERIVNIIKGLRALSHDGGLDPMESISVQQIFNETIPFCRSKILTEKIALTVCEVAADIFICCRSVQISQVLLNLMNNAFDAVMSRNDDRQIEVFTVETVSRLEIRVRDNGPGIDPNVKRRLFAPFVTSKPVGQGLGLSVSRRMVEANGGELFLDETAKLTTFVISMPRVSAS